jgi:ABC-type transport system involved in multi-copper enzyme maturation permease subunit
MIPLVIARNTFREAIRDRALFGMVGAGVVLLVVTQLISPLAMGEGRRLTIDLGLAGISIIGLVLVLLVGTSLVAKEVERRTIYNLLSRPITRSAYLVGKWAGLSASLWLFCAFLGVALWGVLSLGGHADHGPALAQAVYLAALELTVVTSVAVMFSALSSPVLSALYTIGLYAIGQWSYDLRLFADKFPHGLANAMGVAANLAPNLPLFNMRTLAANAYTTPASHLVIATLYAMAYCALSLSLATAAFETRDFK